MTYRSPLNLFVALTILSPVHGYDLSDNLFDPAAFPVPYWIDVTNASPEDDGADQINRIRDAFQTWADLPSSTFDAVYQGEKPGNVASDGENQILWADLGSGTFSPLGVTRSHSINGIRSDADILFNLGLGGRFLDYVALHEIGHLFGMNHSDNRDAVMCPTADFSKVEPHWDDIEGITLAYPADDLSDIVPVSLVRPLYFTPNDLVWVLEFTFQNVGLVVAATTTVEMYLSTQPEFDRDESFFLGEVPVYIDSNGPYQVMRNGVFSTIFIEGATGYFFLRLDTEHTVFESDETNNLGVFPVPIVPDVAFNGDADLSGSIDFSDLLLLQLFWQRRDIFHIDLRFDFDQNHKVVADDLVEMINRWGEDTLPEKSGR